MKAFLLQPDSDFDPTLLLSRRESFSHMRVKEKELDLIQALPWNHTALVQDLGLEILLNDMARGDSLLFEVGLVALLNGSCKPDVIRYRQGVLRDCLQHGDTVRRMYEIAVEALKEERKQHWSPMTRYPAGTLYHAVEVLGVFINGLKQLRALADRSLASVSSKGFSRLFAMLRAELSEQYFAEIEGHLKRLKFQNGVLVSAQLGKGNKGTNYVLRRPLKEPGWLARFWPSSEGYTFHLHPRDEAGGRALSELRNRGVNLVADALAQSMDHISSFFQMLRTELAFYVGCLNVHEHLQDMGAPSCFPDPLPLGTHALRCSGLYDVSLAISMKRRPVGNDLDADGKDAIVITGANTGGKSTFLRSLGLGQLMMQAGMFVPADTFSAEVRRALISHYKREEDVTMESGKLDEELSRMSEIVEHLQSGSMLLFNESFAATNEREGAEIAKQITAALVERGVKVCHVTHLYQFAHDLYRQKMPNAAFLRAERQEDGARTFKMIEGGPLQTSYGEDLYDQVFGGKRQQTVKNRHLSAAE